MPELTPLLKWAGGKRWLAPRIKEMYEKSRNNGYCEPFVGAGAVALALRPRAALLNDINPHLINFHSWVKNGLAKHTGLAILFNTPEIYFGNRERFNAITDPPFRDTATAAILFWYLNRTCFNGLCRFNRAGKFNVGYGKYSKIDYAGMIRQWPAHQSAMADWEFTQGDFEHLRPAPGMFVYCDPPYDASFVGYHEAGFNWPDHVRLAMWADRHDGPIAISNLATERMIALYQDGGFQIELLDAPRRISCNGDRAPAQELLAIRI